MPVDISILITTRSRAAHLRKTLVSMAAVVPPAGSSAELVVVDNGSTDDTREVVQACTLPHLAVRYLLEPKPGQTNARNAGMAASTGSIIAFIDDDVRPYPGWLEGITEPLRTGSADVVAGGVRLAPDVLRPWMNETHRSMLAENTRLDASNPSVVGANFAFSRRVLDKVPAFDPELGPGALGFADDTLFGMQLATAGYRFADGSGAKVEHHPDPSRLKRDNYLDHARRLGQSFGYFAWHWSHEPLSRLPLHEMKKAVELWQKRNRLRREWGHDEGMSLEEINLLYHLHRFRQYRLESRKPRKYARHGLVKLVP